MNVKATIAQAKREFEQFLKEVGSEITLADGKTSICVCDTNQDTAGRYASSDLLESAGRLALFHFRVGTRVKGGDTNTFKGERWSMYAPNNLYGLDTQVNLVMVAKSGAS